ncbi:MAG: hypothetical protein ACI9HA_000519, partial [Dinoroseobacter sp.]
MKTQCYRHSKPDSPYFYGIFTVFFAKKLEKISEFQA